MGYAVKIKGKWPTSKKALKEAMRDDPQSVTWINTSLHGNFAECTFRGDLLPDGLDDTFAGPNAYADRAFYGQIKVKGDKVTLK